MALPTLLPWYKLQSDTLLVFFDSLLGVDSLH